MPQYILPSALLATALLMSNGVLAESATDTQNNPISQQYIGHENDQALRHAYMMEQKRIRNTNASNRDYWEAIAVTIVDGNVQVSAYSGQEDSEEEAAQTAIASCGKNGVQGCHVVATAKNTCVYATGDKALNYYVATNADPRVAIMDSYKKCDLQSKSKNCFGVSTIGSDFRPYAVCSGYIPGTNIPYSYNKETNTYNYAEVIDNLKPNATMENKK